VDAVVHVSARRNANRHRRTGGRRPYERVSACIIFDTVGVGQDTPCRTDKILNICSRKRKKIVIFIVMIHT